MPKEKSENFFTELLKFALIAVVVVVPVRLFIAQPFIVSGASMVPTFLNGQYLIVDELSYRFEAPKRGDVIIFRYPKDPSQFFIKRIVGLPGETVVLANGTISVQKSNGESMLLDESYVVNQGNGANHSYSVPMGEYFVLGDNRPESSDSRTWGLVPRANIVGRAFIRLLPVQTIDIFPGNTAQPQ